MRARLIDQDLGFTLTTSAAPFDPLPVDGELRAAKIFPVARELAPAWMQLKAIIGRNSVHSFIEIYARRGTFLGAVPGSRPSDVEIVYV